VVSILAMQVWREACVTTRLAWPAAGAVSLQSTMYAAASMISGLASGVFSHGASVSESAVRLAQVLHSASVRSRPEWHATLQLPAQHAWVMSEVMSDKPSVTYLQ
jgi:hypothetical protein